MLDYIDPRIGIPIAIILWAILLVWFLKDKYQVRIDNYFAKRRHIRRERTRAIQNEAAMRDYLAKDVAATVAIFEKQKTTHKVEY